MSGKISSGAPVLFCPRNPNTATSAMVKRRKMRRKPRSIIARSKFQIPSSKLQRNSKLQIPNACAKSGGTWNLVLVWTLEFGICNFLSSFLVNNRDVLTAAALEQIARFHLGEARVARFDDEKETVVRRAAAETFPIEKRMIPARQAVHDLPGEKCRERTEQHGELKHDREKCRHRHEVGRFAVNDE